jgi:hypothetical protein
MGGIVINYRGEDSLTAAALIDRELTARFGSEQVFLDSRSMPVGSDSVEELLEVIRNAPSRQSQLDQLRAASAPGPAAAAVGPRSGRLSTR